MGPALFIWKTDVDPGRYDQTLWWRADRQRLQESMTEEECQAGWCEVEMRTSFSRQKEDSSQRIWKWIEHSNLEKSTGEGYKKMQGLEAQCKVNTQALKVCQPVFIKQPNDDENQVCQMMDNYDPLKNPPRCSLLQKWEQAEINKHTQKNTESWPDKNRRFVENSWELGKKGEFGAHE